MTLNELKSKETGTLLKYKSIERLQAEGSPIIIVTAVKESEAVLNACRNNNINIAGFCDSIKAKSENTFCGLPVIHTPSLPDNFDRATRFIIASQHIQDCIEQLTDLGYNDFYSPLELLEKYDVTQNRHLISESYMKARLSVSINSHRMFLEGKEKTYMRSLDVMVTTRCSLKCESCCNLMQYYQPQDHKKFDDNEILKSIDLIRENVDFISEFRVIGGEPLMNHAWADITNHISDNNPDQEIFIYTNGSIPAKDRQLESFQGKKINFIITSYGELSRHLRTLENQLDKYNINYVTTPAQYWVDCSSISHHKRTPDKLKEVFKECCVKYIYTLLNGKLYRCPFIANAANLNSIPDNPANYVDLFSTKDDLKIKIKRLIKTAEFFPGCDFCDGRPYDATSAKGYDGKGIVKAGIQTPTILPYKKYL